MWEGEDTRIRTSILLVSVQEILSQLLVDEGRNSSIYWTFISENLIY